MQLNSCQVTQRWRWMASFFSFFMVNLAVWAIKSKFVSRICLPRRSLEPWWRAGGCGGSGGGVSLIQPALPPQTLTDSSRIMKPLDAEWWLWVNLERLWFWRQLASRCYRLDFGGWIISAISLTPGNRDGAVPVALRQTRNFDWAHGHVRAVPACTFDLQQAQWWLVSNRKHSHKHLVRRRDSIHIHGRLFWSNSPQGVNVLARHSLTLPSNKWHTRLSAKLSAEISSSSKSSQ